jgi:hypothetical protein
LLFIRAVADIDTPHIRLLTRIASERVPYVRENSGAPQGWSADTVAERDPGLGEAVPALLPTLESHGLVRAEDQLATWAGMMSKQAYNVTSRGRTLLERLAAEGGVSSRLVRQRFACWAGTSLRLREGSRGGMTPERFDGPP